MRGCERSKTDIEHKKKKRDRETALYINDYTTCSTWSIGEKLKVLMDCHKKIVTEATEELFRGRVQLPRNTLFVGEWKMSSTRGMRGGEDIKNKKKLVPKGQN